MKIELEIHPVGSHRWYIRRNDFTILHVEITSLSIQDGGSVRTPYQQRYEVKTVGWRGKDHMDPQIGSMDLDIPYACLFMTREDAEAERVVRLENFRSR